MRGLKTDDTSRDHHFVFSTCFLSFIFVINNVVPEFLLPSLANCIGGSALKSFVPEWFCLGQYSKVLQLGKYYTVNL